MPTKSEFSIRKLIPQRKTEDDTTPFPPTPPPEKTHWLQPRKPTLAGRRGAADPPVLGGTESLREIISPVPLPDAPYSCPSPPFARASGEFGWAARREVRRSMSPRARSGLWEDGLGEWARLGGRRFGRRRFLRRFHLGRGWGTGLRWCLGLLRRFGRVTPRLNTRSHGRASLLRRPLGRAPRTVLR